MFFFLDYIPFQVRKIEKFKKKQEYILFFTNSLQNINFYLTMVKLKAITRTDKDYERETKFDMYKVTRTH